MAAIHVDGLRNPDISFPQEFFIMSYFHFSLAQKNVLSLENFNGREKSHIIISLIDS